MVIIIDIISSLWIGFEIVPKGIESDGVRIGSRGVEKLENVE